MQKDIRILVIILIIGIALLVWIQSTQCSPIPNDGQLNGTSPKQYFTIDNKPKQYNSANLNDNLFKLNQNTQSQPSNKIKGLSKKIEDEDSSRSSRESQKLTSKIVDNILKNESEQNQNLNRKSRFFNENLAEELSDPNSLEEMSLYQNPIAEDINSERNSLDDPEQQVLDELIKEVNTGNDLVVDNPKSELYRSKSKSINSAKKYRNISYKDSGYRYDFNENGDPSQTSQDELNSLYDDALIFKNNEYNNNDNFKGFNEPSQNYGGAGLNDFKAQGPQTQQEKIMSLYNSNEYLPNNNLLDKNLTKGFQILDNPVAVSNPNLIPVLKSIPVSSVMGSNKNQTYDIRAEPPCPKTVVSPFLNSSIMPDIYSTQRGCL